MIAPVERNVFAHKTLRSAGAHSLNAGCFYKHLAPLEPPNRGRAASAKRCNRIEPWVFEAGAVARQLWHDSQGSTHIHR